MNGYNFTERVRKTLGLARDEAARLRSGCVDTEHILLGLLREGEGTAIAVLRQMSVDPHQMLREVEDRTPPGKQQSFTDPDLPYTARAKKVLELAMSEARELNSSYVGTEHLLLGLVREDRGIAAKVLTDAGVSIEAARIKTLAILHDHPPHREAEFLPYRAPTDARPETGALHFSREPVIKPLLEHMRWLVGPGPFSARVTVMLLTLLKNAARDGKGDFTAEDLLLGLLDAGGTATGALTALGVDLNQLTTRLEALRAAEAGEANDRPGGSPGPDAPIVRVFWQAGPLAAFDSDRPLSTGHLLLALLAETRGPAYQALTELGVTRERAREAVDRITE